ncbi:ferric-chelate reductase-like protein [Sporormia fimetaria CBS 119925]|uniref:Ferric-chelate reductase-like protein n=1 Tax=Sporormia fimetaria CBS 119925 TaxID=1340428 RepID=A0A6A6UWX6_9PLEO|nr:ferric-chelate reductase-like protein [Sporormia fimetaria CBS 119925]
MRFLVLHLLLVTLSTKVRDVEGKRLPRMHCFDGCDLTLNYVEFDDTARLSKKSKRCHSTLHAKSLYLCLDQYCSSTGREDWLRSANHTCKATADIWLPPWEVIDGYTPEDIAGLRRLKAEEGMWNSHTPPLHEVVMPAPDFVDRAARTLDYAFFEMDTHWAYGIAMLYFWAVVITVGLCWRLLGLIREAKHTAWRLLPGGEAGTATIDKNHSSSGTYALMKRLVIIPATFGYRCSQNIGWCTIPPRIQTLTIAAFVVLNIVLCSISYPVFSGNLYWSAISTQLWRYVSDRTGVISLANFPLIWLFGTRNNVLMWLTGWGFGTYNNFHRWVARVATVQAVIHSIGYTEMIFERGDWPLFMKYWGKHYFWNGEVATILMCALSLLSVYGLRRCHYEVFLVAHIVLSAVVLLTTFYHVEIFNGEWNIFIWPCLLIWILDRALRFIRIIAFNRKVWNTAAMTTYDQASNIVRLEIPCDTTLIKPQAGAYYYVYFLNNVLFAHQNHPFTLAYVSTTDSATRNIHVVSGADPALTRPTYPRSPSASSSESDRLLPQTMDKSLSSLVFLIRPYAGLTSRLRNISNKTTRNLRVLVEGPYGSPNALNPNPLHSFSSVLFIAGGSGIAIALSHLSTLFAEESNVLDVHIVWAVREHAFASDILQRDIPASIRQDERFKMTVHVTQHIETKDDVRPEGSRRKLHNVVIKVGRPDVTAAVEHAAQEAGVASLAVVACGPAQMADDARRACVRALEEGYRGMEYFEESFKW